MALQPAIEDGEEEIFALGCDPDCDPLSQSKTHLRHLVCHWPTHEKRVRKSSMLATTQGRPTPTKIPRTKLTTLWYHGTYEPPSPRAGAWLRSAARGCKPCRIVVGAVAALEPDWFQGYDGSRPDDDYGMNHKHIFAYTKPGMPLQVVLADMLQNVQFLRHKEMQVFVPTNNIGAWPTVGSGPTVCLTNSEPEAMSKAKRWLGSCREEHADCASLQSCLDENPFMPTRLLNVTFGKVALVDGDDIEGPYAALSYCWGEGAQNVVRTLRDNLRHHYEAIPMDRIPAAVRDAIAITRGLELKYLWVDALCIIQDDDADWAAEAAGMSCIYHRADVVLRNETSNDCRRTMFTSQGYGSTTCTTTFSLQRFDFGHSQFADTLSRSRVAKMSCRRLAKDDDPEAIHVRIAVGDVHRMAQTWNQAACHPLGSRAWPLQEGFLGRRLITFTPYEMSWRCLEGDFCECYELSQAWLQVTPWADRIYKLSNTEPAMKHLLMKDGPRRLFTDDNEFLDFYWTHLVKDYTARYMTQSGDRLVAIDGIRRVCQDFSSTGGPDRIYVAGHCEHNLLESLIWSYNHAAGLRTRHPSPPFPGRQTNFWEAALEMAGDDRQALSIYLARDFDEAVLSGKPINSLDVFDTAKPVERAIAKMLRSFPSWSWLSSPCPVNWPMEARHCEPQVAESIRSLFIPSAELLNARADPSPGDRRGRIVHGSVTLEGHLFPVQARSMPITEHALTTPPALDGTDLPSEFVIATSGAGSFHQVRFPSDHVIGFRSDLPCLYGDNVKWRYSTWSPKVLTTLEAEADYWKKLCDGFRERFLPDLPDGDAATSSHDGLDYFKEDLDSFYGHFDPFPCWEKPKLDPNFDPVNSSEYAALKASSLYPRPLCAEPGCGCRRGWTSSERHPLWALKIGSYRQDDLRGRSMPHVYFLILKRSPFSSDAFLRIGLAHTAFYGDEAGSLHLFGPSTKTTVTIE